MVKNAIVRKVITNSDIGSASAFGRGVEIPTNLGPLGRSYSQLPCKLHQSLKWGRRVKWAGQFAFLEHHVIGELILEAARSKAWVCGHSFSGIVGSNPAWGINVSFFECCLLSGWGLLVGLITHPEESYRVWFVQWGWLRKPLRGCHDPELGRRATGS